MGFITLDALAVPSTTELYAVMFFGHPGRSQKRQSRGPDPLKNVTGVNHYRTALSSSSLEKDLAFLLPKRVRTPNAVGLRVNAPT